MQDKPYGPHSISCPHSLSGARLCMSSSDSHFLATCSGGYQQVKKALEAQFPSISVVGSNYPPPGYNARRPLLSPSWFPVSLTYVCWTIANDVGVNTPIDLEALGYRKNQPSGTSCWHAMAPKFALGRMWIIIFMVSSEPGNVSRFCTQFQAAQFVQAGMLSGIGVTIWGANSTPIACYPMGHHHGILMYESFHGLHKFHGLNTKDALNCFLVDPTAIAEDVLRDVNSSTGLWPAGSQPARVLQLHEKQQDDIMHGHLVHRQHHRSGN
eukprot:55618-Prorocentrum_minimum.AAC.1